MLEFSLPPELQLVLLSGRTVLSPDERQHFLELASKPFLDWEGLLALASRHRLTPSVYNHLKSTSARVPLEVSQELNRRYEAIVARNLRLAAELLSLNAAFQGEGIDSVWFKGPVLSCQAYGNLFQRQSIDVDVLAPKRRIDDVNRMMVERGYVPAFNLTTPRQQRLHERISSQHAFQDPNHGIWIDVHWALTEDGYSFSTTSPLPTIDLDFMGQEIGTFEPGASFCYLCYHGSKHGWGSIAWIRDLMQLTQRYPDAVSGYLTGSVQPPIGTVRMLRLGVLLSHKLLGMPLPENQYKWASLDGKARRLSNRVLQISPKSSASPDAIYRGAMTRWRDKVHFLSRKILMPSGLELERATFPARLFVLYRILRGARLLRKYLYRSSSNQMTR